MIDVLCVADHLMVFIGGWVLGRVAAIWVYEHRGDSEFNRRLEAFRKAVAHED